MKRPRPSWVFVLVLSASVASAQPASSSAADPNADWANFTAAIAATPKPDSASGIANARNLTKQAHNFYTAHPNNAHVNEAKRWEALYLIFAYDLGATDLNGDMTSLVASLRHDTSVPASERAIVAGTYEFIQAATRIKKPADAATEYEKVARDLIQEFPDQPQGYVSLLTQATQREVSLGRGLVQEVLDAKVAPTDAVAQARVLMTRFNLVGQSLETVFDAAALGGWHKGSPGVIYFWASWSPESLRFGDELASRVAKGNALSINLDTDQVAAKAALQNHSLPGSLIYWSGGLGDPKAAQFGVNGAPLLFLVDANGVITDVNGLGDTAAKLTALGL